MQTPKTMTIVAIMLVLSLNIDVWHQPLIYSI